MVLPLGVFAASSQNSPEDSKADNPAGILQLSHTTPPKPSTTTSQPAARRLRLSRSCLLTKPVTVLRSTPYLNAAPHRRANPTAA